MTLIKTNLEPHELRLRLRELLSQPLEEEGIGALTSEWTSENHVEVTTSTTVGVVKGRGTIDGCQLDLDLKLPFLLRPLRGRIIKRLQVLLNPPD